MTYYLKKKILRIGVYRTWNKTPLEGTLYGQTCVKDLSLKDFRKVFWHGSAVMDCYGAPEEFQTAVELEDLGWVDFHTAGSATEQPDDVPETIIVALKNILSDTNQVLFGNGVSSDGKMYPDVKQGLLDTMDYLGISTAEYRDYQ